MRVWSEECGVWSWRWRWEREAGGARLSERAARAAREDCGSTARSLISLAVLSSCPSSQRQVDKPTRRQDMRASRNPHAILARVALAKKRARASRHASRQTAARLARMRKIRCQRVRASAPRGRVATVARVAGASHKTHTSMSPNCRAARSEIEPYPPRPLRVSHSPLQTPN